MKILHPSVFIFGAGATRGAFVNESPPPPIDSDFFDIAKQLEGHGTRELTRQVLTSVWELYGQTNGIGLEKYYRDIESRAAIISFAKPANQPKNWKKREKQLQELIRRVCIHTTCQRENQGSSLKPKPSPIHAEILKLLKAKDAIVTFNYDLLIEESFATSELWHPKDGYFAETGGSSFDWCRQWEEKRGWGETRSKVQLLKLHGSLNWQLYPNKAIRLIPRPCVVRTNNKRKPAYEKISILPPGWNKRIDRKPYRNLWREARSRLERCRSLIILGYSLPETDLLAQSLFGEIVRQRVLENNSLEELYLADPKKEVREKLISLWTPALGPYGKVFQYKNIKEFSEIFMKK